MKTIFSHKNKFHVYFSLIFFFLGIIKISSQTFCIDDKSEQITGIKDGYRYELWNQNAQGTACMSVKKGSLFSGNWSGVENYLARRGLEYNQTKEHQEIGKFYADYKCIYKPSKKSAGNSYLSVYGWTIDPLIEFYIIENWQNWIPSMADSAQLKGTIFMNGSYYDIYENVRVNQPSINGITTFKQYFSIRRNKQSSGEINISEHFAKWEELGMDMGKMYEVSFVVEGYQNSGKFKFKNLNLFVK